MTNYVLVGGAWLGGWCWQPVARRLRDNGHDAYPATLTGLGEREHLSRPEIDLDTHITDVVNLIEFEDLHEVVLLGHSYAGIVVTGVADRIPDRISRLVYLDSGPTPDGLSFLDMQPPDVKHHIERQVAQIGDGWRLPLPSWEELENVIGASLEGLDEPQRRLMRAHSVAQPFGTYTQPLRLGNTTAQALLQAGLMDEMEIHLVHVLLGDGRRLFDHLGSDHIEVDLLRRLEDRDVTHLRYRVRRPGGAA
jgi:pimeloyl-ACP methyl ester carboxylesterase